MKPVLPDDMAQGTYRLVTKVPPGILHVRRCSLSGLSRARRSRHLCPKVFTAEVAPGEGGSEASFASFVSRRTRLQRSHPYPLALRPHMTNKSALQRHRVKGIHDA